MKQTTWGNNNLTFSGAQKKTVDSEINKLDESIKEELKDVLTEKEQETTQDNTQTVKPNEIISFVLSDINISDERRIGLLYTKKETGNLITSFDITIEEEKTENDIKQSIKDYCSKMIGFDINLSNINFLGHVFTKEVEDKNYLALVKINKMEQRLLETNLNYSVHWLTQNDMKDITDWRPFVIGMKNVLYSQGTTIIKTKNDKK